MNWFVVGSTDPKYTPYPEAFYVMEDADLTAEASGKDATIMRVKLTMVDPIAGSHVKIHAMAVVKTDEGMVIWAGEGDEGKVNCPDMAEALDGGQN